MRQPGRNTRGILVGLSILTAAGAAADPAPPPAAVQACRELFARVDAAVTRAGVRDAQSTAIAGLPYLRTDRFLSDGVEPVGDSEFAAWVDRLRALDRAGRRAELANLPADYVSDVIGGATAAGQQRLLDTLDTCAAALRRHDLADPLRRDRLLNARVADDYRLSLRALGLYPLTSIGFLYGVRNLQRETRATFATPLDDLPVAGTLQRFVAAGQTPGLDPAGIAALLAASADNPLGIPDPAAAAERRLLRQFAPIWEIDSLSAADRPGWPGPANADAAGGKRTVPGTRGDPVTFTLISHTRWRNRTLLQLNYVLWFDARPLTGRFDTLGGALDGILWRVTLGSDGRPLFLDVVHTCGCYHMIFPAAQVRQVRERIGWQEPISVPQTAPIGNGPLIVRVASGTHYVERVYRDGAANARSDSDASPADLPEEDYVLADYDGLRAIRGTEGERRSLFRSSGLVAGTERGERWLFWPMGVTEPGAMRQWGHHAIAFVGRRHFDDPHLFERYFEPGDQLAE